jgi:anti-anti-sigma regulatory factor
VGGTRGGGGGLAVTRRPLARAVRSRDVGRMSVRVDDGMVVVTVSGNMDAVAAAAFAVQLRELSAVCVGTLKVDLLACNEITTVVLGVLERVHADSGSGRCRLAVVARHPEIATALKRAGIPEPS